MSTVELPGGTLLVGDCLERLRELPDASIDAVVTDPPYNLSFMAKPWDTYDGREDAGFAYWLSGLIDGEGHFGIKAHTRGTHAPFFALKMRSDERGLLERICRTLGVGTISEERREPNPMVKYVIQDKSGCQRLVDLLDKYPLRAKKRLDYWAWREAVCDWSARPRGNRWAGQADNTHMAHLRDRLMETRAYTDVPWSGHEFQDWCRLWATEVLRVLKPGGHLLAFGGTRTYHRLACALEDAGFELRDSIAAWMYGSGMPKGLDLSKAIDKAAGATRVIEGRHATSTSSVAVAGNDGRCLTCGRQRGGQPGNCHCDKRGTPCTEDAARWEGWNTALKPAWEPILVARKPPVGTVAANVLTYGVGGLNIDGCRVAAGGRPARLALGEDTPGKTTYGSNGPGGGSRAIGTTDTGRWPANTVLAHHPECELVGERTVKGDARAGQAKGQRPGGFGDVGSSNGDPAPAGALHGDDAVEVFDCHPDCWVRKLDGQSGVLTSGKMMPTHTAAGADGRPSAYGKDRAGGFVTMETYGDSGGASRYFPTFRYEAKASSAERRIGHVGDEAAHPTVKPIDLMRWLLRLVVPPGGRVLDPFLGSGTTAVAAVLEGFDWIGCELTEDYVPIIEARVRAAKSYEGLPTEALVKARGRRRPKAEAEAASGAVQVSLFDDGDAA